MKMRRIAPRRLEGGFRQIAAAMAVLLACAAVVGALQALLLP